MSIKKVQTASEYTYKIGNERKVVVNRKAGEEYNVSINVHVGGYSSDSIEVKHAEDLAKVIAEYKDIVAALQEEYKEVNKHSKEALEPVTKEEK